MSAAETFDSMASGAAMRVEEAASAGDRMEKMEGSMQCLVASGRLLLTIVEGYHELFDKMLAAEGQSSPPEVSARIGIEKAIVLAARNEVNIAKQLLEKGGWA